MDGMKRKANDLLLFIFMIQFFITASILAQQNRTQVAVDSARIDSSRMIQPVGSLPDSVETREVDLTDFSGEIMLEEIKIEAIIETPSVAIMPKRAKPELGKMEFMDRSFENELKAVPKKPMLLKKEFQGVKEINKEKAKSQKDK